MNRRWRRGQGWLIAVLVIGGGCVLAEYVVWLHRRYWRCIVAAGMSLRNFASDHGGGFPAPTNGFGNPFAGWARSFPREIPVLVGPGDDGSWLRDAAFSGESMVAEVCSRIYVQGLNESLDSRIVVRVDRFETRGGDHSPRPWAGYLRGAIRLDGSLAGVPVAGGPAFARNQVQLLVQAGIPRATAEACCRPTLDPNAKR
jgi:hypothetical protein